MFFKFEEIFMIEGFEERNFIVNEELSNGFVVEFTVDDFQADFTHLRMIGLVHCRCETGANLLKFAELFKYCFIYMIHCSFLRYIINRK